MKSKDKPLVWLEDEVRTPPFSQAVHLEAGYLLRQLQLGEKLGLPRSHPIPSIRRKCQELRIVNSAATWKILYRIDQDAIAKINVFSKITENTTKSIVETCKMRLRAYDKIG